MKIKPQGDRLLIVVIDDKETATPNVKLKLYLPEQKETYGMPRKGKILAVGTGPICKRMDFKKGDVVYFSKFAGQAMKLSPRAFDKLGENFKEGETYLFLNTKDIYGRTYEKAV